MSRITEVPVENVFTLQDCLYAARLVTRGDDEALARRVHDYVAKSPLLPKLVHVAATKHLKAFIVTNFLAPITCEFVRAQRQERDPSPMKSAAIWRLFACKCSTTEKGSEVPDASNAELRKWLPVDKLAPKRRWVRCATCKNEFRVTVDSNQTKCNSCRFPGMKPPRGMANVNFTPSEPAFLAGENGVRPNDPVSEATYV